MSFENMQEQPYMGRVAPDCHVQVPILSAIGKGPKGDKGDRGLPGDSSRHDFENASLMAQESDLEPGDICHTLGFYEAGDGDAAWYIIKDHETPGVDNIEIVNGMFASYVYSDS